MIRDFLNVKIQLLELKKNNNNNNPLITWTKKEDGQS